MAKKQASLDSVFADLQKEFDCVMDIDTSGVTKRFTLESPQLNYILGGGFPKGRILEFYGPESSGKSTLCTYLAAQNQQRNIDRPMVLYLDIERTFDKYYAMQLGLDISKEKFIYTKPQNGEEAFQLCEKVIKALPVGVIIWDSIGATAARKQMDDPFKSQFGGTASVLSAGLPWLNPLLDDYDTTLLFINQERAQIGGFSPIPGATSTPGGFARKYYCSSRNRITKIETLKEGGEAVGIRMKVRNVKSKMGLPWREAILDLNFYTGINSDGEYLDFILKLLCTRKGSWYDNEEWGMHVQGANGVADFMTEHPDIYEYAKTQVNEALCKTTVLDKVQSKSEDELEGMTAEEKAWATYKSEDSE